MIKNYWKIAVRTLIRNKTFSLINLLGLTSGTVCFLYILLFVQYHQSFDRHHSSGDQIYRIVSDLQLGNEAEVLHMATCSPPIPVAMQEDFPEVEMATRVVSHPALEQNLMRVDDRVFYEKKGLYADSTFFRMFDYHFIEGEPNSSLDQPFSIVISKELANKLFDDQVAWGKVVQIGGAGEEQPYKVTGVYDDKYGDSHLMPAFFISMNSGGIGEYIRTSQSWAGNNFIYGYVRLHAGADHHLLEHKLPDFLLTHGAEQLEQADLRKVLHLQPVSTIHTSTELTSDIPGNTSKRFLNILLIIAGFIQLVACINFMNLTTARSSKRAREVGIRKTIGAPRKALMGQFLGESLLLATVAMLLAIPLLEILLPKINHFIGVSYDLSLHFDFKFIILLILLIGLTGLLAGSYPAFYLSSFKPLAVLRDKAKTASGAAGIFRKSMVVSQFGIAIILVIGAMVIQAQLQYLLEEDLGFEKENKLVISFQSEETRDHLDLFRDNLLRYPEVVSVAALSRYPGQFLINDIPMYKEGDDMSRAVDIRFIYGDEHFFKTLKINVIAGRELTQADTTIDGNSLRVVVNQTVLGQLGITQEDASGQILRTQFEDANFNAMIVGVMEDIQFQSLTGEMGPFMVIAEPARNLSYLVADVSSDDYIKLMQKIESTWKDLMPEYPFEYSFLDENIQALYLTESSLSRIITTFTLLAILISCLGLFGLSVFAAEQRIKEIGIRKVLGASTFGIVRLLSFDFLKLVLLGLFFAIPVSYYFLENWLADFAHRIDISYDFFLLAALASVSIAFVTVSFQSVKAALTNPAKSLQSE